MKRILVVTPEFPKIPTRGACEHDRINGILQLKRLGYDIHVLTRCADESRVNIAKEFSKKHNISIITSLYSSKKGRAKRKWLRLFVPTWWDGQAFEFKDKEVHEQLVHELDTFSPDLIWFDYTFLWPLYKHAQNRKIPIITRSINFEPDHFLQEDAKTIFDYFKYIGKRYSERRIVLDSDMVLSINPLEGKRYTHMGAHAVLNLPLRGLTILTDNRHQIRDREPLKVVFMGSTYNVSHNRHALEFIINDVAPNIGNEFEFHITGSKMPDELLSQFGGNVIFHGFINDLDTFLADIDIALVPSLHGCGMQQKVFEPLYIGIPTITHNRGVAGYPFKDRTHVMFAEDAGEFVSALKELQSTEKRMDISKAAQTLSHKLFGREKSDLIITNAINVALS